jgi:hypothetical protein
MAIVSTAVRLGASPQPVKSHASTTTGNPAMRECFIAASIDPQAHPEQSAPKTIRPTEFLPRLISAAAIVGRNAPNSLLSLRPHLLLFAPILL